MYTQTYRSHNGKHRGVDGTFNRAAFATLQRHEQEAACQIPLSQPDFFFIVLCIWSLTCMSEMRKSVNLFQSLIMNTENCQSMGDSLTTSEEGELLIARLTINLKVLIMALVIIPRVSITCYLLWLGCRWLLATTDFGDLILNAVALEFILMLKDLLFSSLVTLRNKLDLGRTKVMPRFAKEGATITAFTRTIIYGVMSVLWVVIYMGLPPGYLPAFVSHHFHGLQTVLPDYKWDVHDVCVDWIKWRYCVNEPCPTTGGGGGQATSHGRHGHGR